MRDESAVLLTLLLFFLLGIQAIRSRGRFEGPTEASNNQKGDADCDHRRGTIVRNAGTSHTDTGKRV